LNDVFDDQYIEFLLHMNRTNPALCWPGQTRLAVLYPFPFILPTAGCMDGDCSGKGPLSLSLLMGCPGPRGRRNPSALGAVLSASSQGV
jgi:hypothetical protein